MCYTLSPVFALYFGCMLLRLGIKVMLLSGALFCAHTCTAQYIVTSLCKTTSQFNDSTPRCVVLLNVPPNTVRILYSITTDAHTQPPYTGLDSQATALLPDKLGWLGIASIAEKIKGPASQGLTDIYFFDNKRCVEKFASYNKKNCKARWQMDSCTGGTFDIPWQATLFPEKYYLCLINPRKYTPQYFTIEVVAIVAE